MNYCTYSLILFIYLSDYGNLSLKAIKLQPALKRRVILISLTGCDF